MKKVRIIIIILIVLVFSAVITTSIKKYDDARMCDSAYRTSCVIIMNKFTRMTYLSIDNDCESLDCNGKKMDSSYCKKNTKRYFKFVSEQDYKNLNKEISKKDLNEWHSICDTLEGILGN